MKRFIKSLKEKRGSVLFMVLSMMSLMIVIASAIYFTVLSSRQTQLTDFYDEQAYQTALSVSDVLTEYIRGASASDGITTMITNLSNVGDTVSTGNNDFLAFGGDQESLAKLGAFKVDITYNGEVTSGTASYKMYDVAVTSNYNGVEETIHTIMNFYEGTSEFPGFDKFFTATGYSTGDVYVENGFIGSDAFFDNEYTIIRGRYQADGSQAADIVAVWGSIHCGGSLIINNTGGPRQAGCPFDIIVGNNLTIDGNNNLFNTMKDGSIYVGGDCTITNASIGDCTSLYVLGNLTIINSNVKASEMYVGGNMYFSGANLEGKAFVNGAADFYSCNLNKDVKCNTSNNTSSRISKAENASGSTDAWILAGSKVLKISQDRTLVDYENNGTYYYNTITDVTKLIADMTTVSLYPQWDPDTDGLTHIDIDFSSTSNDCTYVIKKSVIIDSITMDDYMYSKTIPDQNFSYGGLNINTNGNKQCVPTVVISNYNEDEALVVQLRGNCKTNSTNDTFCWAGADDDGDPRQQPVNVIILGDGPVVFELEGETKFVQNSYDFYGHLGFYAMFTSNNSQGTNRAYQQYLELLVASAASDCGFIDYYGTITSNVNIIGSSYQNYAEYVNGFTNCLNYTAADVASHNTGTHCDYYDEDKGGCQHFGCLNPDRVEAFFQTKCSNSYCPSDIHNNIFIVSTVKNADVKFEGEHAFFGGFIYAPYMTYDTSTIPTSDYGLTIAGGMIVSDYSIADQRGYIFFKPSVDIQDLNGFGEGDDLLPVASRTWKTIGH